MKRREYNLNVTVNGLRIDKVVIDPHYEEKHSDSLDDQVIRHLVEQLDGQHFEPEAIHPPFSYFVTDKMEIEKRLYKLIWILEEDAFYVGVINAYRRK